MDKYSKNVEKCFKTKKLLQKCKIKVSYLNSQMYESNHVLRKHCLMPPTKKCILN